jgi:hypothetical protein
MKMKFTLLLGLCLLIGSTGYSQCTPGSGDPAVTSRNLLDQPLAGVGSLFRLEFKIGNFGAGCITGADANNRMGFTINFTKCVPAPAGSGVDALSGPLLPFFDITYNSVTNQFNGIQKQGVSLPSLKVYTLDIQLQVTQASPVELGIGGSCTIIPNQSDTNQPSSNDFAAIYTNENGAMPVNLVWFRAEAQPEKTVGVSWQTSMESGNKGYVVERSKDLVSFEMVGEVNDVAGNSSSLNTYKFTDKSPLRGLSYYRLKQLDLSGSSRTYAAVPVTIDGVYGVYPNPIGANGFTLSLDEPASAILHLYNVSGHSIKLDKSDIGTNSVGLTPMEKLTSGVYVLRVEERGQVRTHRLVVQ